MPNNISISFSGIITICDLFNRLNRNTVMKCLVLHYLKKNAYLGIQEPVQDDEIKYLFILLFVYFCLCS